MRDAATGTGDDALPTGDGVVVTFRGVNKWFGDFHVLRDINMVVGRGEKVVVCGPSGSGKSTMIRCINRLEEHQEGSIIVDGTELVDDTRKIETVRRRVGMVFQQFNLFPHLSVMENLTMAPVFVHGIPEHDAEARAMELLERVKIPEQAWKYPGQLSGGQQQRVAIARALMLQPKLMLFDEVTSSNSIICGRMARARAMPTRCCWPPESREGYSPRLSNRPMLFSRSSATAVASARARPLTRIGASMTLSSTEIAPTTIP